jgi:hypothetical protein
MIARRRCVLGLDQGPPQATRKQAIDLQAAILSALRKRNGGMVVGRGAPARWRLARLEEAAN